MERQQPQQILFRFNFLHKLSIDSIESIQSTVYFFYFVATEVQNEIEKRQQQNELKTVSQPDFVSLFSADISNSFLMAKIHFQLLCCAEIINYFDRVNSRFNGKFENKKCLNGQRMLIISEIVMCLGTSNAFASFPSKRNFQLAINEKSNRAIPMNRC